MSSKKRKSEEDPTAIAAVSSDSASKKRRRISDAVDEDVPRVEKKSKKDKKVKKEKKEKKSKKSSKKEKSHKRASPVEDEIAAEETTAPEVVDGPSAEAPVAQDPPTAVEGEASVEKPSKKSKKEKKDKKDKKKGKKSSTQPSTTEPAPTPSDPPPTAAGAGASEEEEEEQDTTGGNQNGKKSRFIVFVGNLPYSATAAQITAHFSAVHPTSVRLLHDPKTKKSRGVAFVEFARYDHMKTCLKTLHHSTFTCPPSTTSAKDKRPAAPEERKINVELTAGGGGNTANRKEKIRSKNAKLNEQRARRIEAEIEAKAEKAREKAARGGGDGEEEKKEAAGRSIEDAVHPSRRRRVPGA
ncbi:uncharacterized protein F4807DRAFT_339623 [Annulohypoxylon truncatum]|uniref:uncharacterized protein n=1 Tax=Annulohypoxylon truncatum TaxID=327061 RepID=UPI0020072232|nr:uncharacterized protein F4807DRAFT_339623 [Annulohypoxylon truncatum]KAI1212522.1 hypothetical protein F4807DRAFT_339623 [Annulohypoxylon truncatum]